MQLSINRSIFLEELSKANKIIDVRSVVPLLGGILIEVDVDKMTIISSSGTLSYKSVLNQQNSDLEIKEIGRILIKSKHILDMLRKIEDDFIDLTSIENNELRISTKNIEFNINILDSEEYPLIGFREKGVKINIDPKSLKQALNQTTISIYEWNKKIALTGANFKTEENNLIISTTDMHRISYKKIYLQNQNVEDINIIIPYKTIIELPKFIEGAKNIELVASEGYASFIIDNSIFQSNLIDGQYPKVEGVFPKEFTNTITVDSRKFLKTLSRADLPSDDGLAATINLKLTKEILFVRTNVAEIGNFEEEFKEFSIQGDGDLMINFNSKFLQEAIKTFEGEEIELKFVNSAKAVVINKKNEDNLKQVVLPTFLG
ncbi:DNA polymerase III subunit beta [Williamsoniiplasma somnilux]|uniref:Beta sliding clamp n=1 Tax=Williamsoniiplasma somnilux TaxID=215578 RepID=A0A2K8NYU8_9MOLU|nr:DNA polymerase III subunit beta [Williamsoniiplasma somnilux]ATZ18388.1 DNA polymerase III subunit beta [Williamsoniiplasma somnilux]